MSKLYYPDDPINRVLRHEHVSPVPVTAVYEFLGPLELYRTEQRYARWCDVLRDVGSTRLVIDYEMYYHLELGIQTDILDMMYPPPAWQFFPTIPGPDSIAGCMIERRGEALFWIDTNGKERLIPKRHAPHEDTGGTQTSGYENLWDNREQDLEKLLHVTRHDERMPTAAEVEARIDSDSLRLAKDLKRRYPNLPFYAFAGTPYDALVNTLGFKTMMEMFIDQPAVIHTVLEQRLPRAHDALHYLIAQRMGVGIVFMQECLASADLISPKMYLEFSFPYTKQALQFFNDLGFSTVLYFSGNLMPLLEYIKELPFTALSFEENRKDYGIDLTEIRRVLGPERVLLGNIDASFLETASDNEVSVEVARQIGAAGVEGNFIMSTGSPFTPRTSGERVRFFLESTR